MKIFVTILIAVLALEANAQNCPPIRTRAAWGARAANTPILPNQPPNHFVIHHTAGARCSTQAACDQQMRNIQNQHMNVNRWPDIGYNFLVGDNGVVYEGRGWNRVGAHSPGFNRNSIGFCFLEIS